MHSLAFGSLLPLIADDPKAAISRKQLEMTLDVMANSLVYWTQDLVRAGLLAERLEDLRDDVGRLDARRARRTARCPRQSRPSSRIAGSSRWSSRGAGPASPSTPSGPA